MTRIVGSRTNRRSKTTIDHDNYSTHSKEASINWIPFSAFPLLSCSFHSATGSETRSMTFHIPGSAFGPNWRKPRQMGSFAMVSCDYWPRCAHSLQHREGDDHLPYRWQPLQRDLANETDSCVDSYSSYSLLKRKEMAGTMGDEQQTQLTPYKTHNWLQDSLVATLDIILMTIDECPNRVDQERKVLSM